MGNETSELALADVDVDVTLLSRTFESEIVESDGRTLIARIVPYNVAAIVSDAPDFRPYRELFSAGAFERQVRAPGRAPKVWLNFEHEQGLRGVVGHGTQLDDQSDALYGHFRVLANADGDKALQLVDEKLLTGLSCEFNPLRSLRVDGVVHRVRAHLDKVSLCRFPAYESAQILAVREQTLESADDVDAETLEGSAESVSAVTPALGGTIPYPDGLEARLRALSVDPLQRIETTSSSWDAAPSRFDASEYARSCLIVREGDRPLKERASLPVLEPDGTLNTNALARAAHAIVNGLSDTRDVTREQKSEAARRLVRYYRTAGMEPPAGLLSRARS